ncbi:GID8A protein, partial [Amia calva]|nr:GID8A protein [Amia calva]
MMSYAEKPEDITKDEWMDKLNNVHIQRADMNRLIMNYLVTEGFKEAAEKFRMESGIEPSIDLDSLDERIKIREMILKGQIQEAIALINSLHPEFCLIVWSEVNQAVLDYENRESTPKLAKLLKLLLWAQNELDQKKVKYPKMTDLSKGTIEDPK